MKMILTIIIINVWEASQIGSWPILCCVFRELVFSMEMKGVTCTLFSRYSRKTFGNETIKFGIDVSFASLDAEDWNTSTSSYHSRLLEALGFSIHIEHLPSSVSSPCLQWQWSSYSLLFSDGPEGWGWFLSCVFRFFIIILLLSTHTLNTQRHPHWCPFMFGVFSSFLTIHAEHKNTSSSLSFWDLRFTALAE